MSFSFIFISLRIVTVEKETFGNICRVTFFFFFSLIVLRTASLYSDYPSSSFMFINFVSRLFHSLNVNLTCNYSFVFSLLIYLARDVIPSSPFFSAFPIFLLLPSHLVSPSSSQRYLIFLFAVLVVILSPSSSFYNLISPFSITIFLFNTTYLVHVFFHLCLSLPLCFLYLAQFVRFM